MKKVKKIIYVLIILVVVIFILILWNLYKCHGEKIILTGYTKGELIQIEVALMLYVNDYGCLPLKLEDLSINNKYIHKENLMDHKIRDINIINWVNDYEKIPFIYFYSSKLYNDSDKNYVLVAEPIPTDGKRFVLLLPTHWDLKKWKSKGHHVVRISEEQFQKQIQKQDENIKQEINP